MADSINVTPSVLGAMRMYAMAYNTQAQFEADEYFVKVARQIEHLESKCDKQQSHINELEAKLEAMHTMARTQLDSPSTVKQQSGYVVCNTICTIYESF